MAETSNPNPNPNAALDLHTKLNPHAAPFPPPLPPQPPVPKMGPSSWFYSKPYSNVPHHVYQLPFNARGPPPCPTSALVIYNSAGSPYWAHPPLGPPYPWNYRFCYRYCYYHPRPAALPPPAGEVAVGPTTAASAPAVASYGSGSDRLGSGTDEEARIPHGDGNGRAGRVGGKWRQSSRKAFCARRRPSSSRSWTSALADGGHQKVGEDSCNGKGKEGVTVDLLGKTSLMIRNIPNQFRRYDLMTILDKHCAEVNHKALAGENPVLSEYDFLYLPMDFVRRANLGYAFVNFTTEAAAMRFWTAFDGYKWMVFTNKKTCTVTKAIIQGKEGFLKHFRNSVFPCHSDSYLPVAFSPPRNGTTCRSRPTLVGRRLGASPAMPRL